MNLAYVSPLPPIPSGVADYSAVLLPHLRPYFSRVVAVVDGYVPQLPPGLVDQVSNIAADIDWWCGGRVVPLYHMGNHIQYHRTIYQALQRFPGVTVLHDGNLLPFVHEATLARGERSTFVREAGLERGSAGVGAAWISLRRSEPLDLDEYPMLTRVARASIGVIVHSQYLRCRLVERSPNTPVTVIPLLAMIPLDLKPVPRQDFKLSLGLDPEGLLIGAFGFIAPSKQLEPALKAFARLRERFPGARFICVGEISPGYNFGAILEQLSLEDAVHVTGHVSFDTFLRYLRAVDVGVNLRYPTWGEASASLSCLMACGVPTVVTDAGAFAEFPDDVVIKVPAGAGEVEAITVALHKLLSDADLRSVIGTAARAFVADQCDPRAIARQYATFIRTVICTSSM